mmetsp:Transcript_6263/g.14775  ORF Transcript_6263/g.14775 Transcript_6263/m.14775 type:complete len:95 (+) Transcript_6263:1997-2281(+)
MGVIAMVDDFFLRFASDQNSEFSGFRFCSTVFDPPDRPFVVAILWNNEDLTRLQKRSPLSLLVFVHPKLEITHKIQNTPNKTKPHSQQWHPQPR